MSAEPQPDQPAPRGEGPGQILETILELRGDDRQVDALERAMDGIRRFPGAFRLRIEAARLLVLADRTDEAIEVLSPAAQAGGALGAGILLISMLRGQGRLAEATEVLDRFQPNHPDHPRLLFERCRLTHATGNVAEALDLAREAAQQHPDNELLRVELGRLLCQQDRHAEALEVLSPNGEAISGASPGLALVRALRDLGRLPEAESALQTVAAENPDNLAVVVERCRLASASGDPERSLQLARDALEEHPENEALRLEAVGAARRAGETAEVMTQMEALTRLPNPSLATRLELGHLFGLAERHEEALAAFERAQQSAPHRIEPVTARARALLLAGRPEEGVHLLDEYADDWSKHASYAITRASLLWGIGELEEAVDVLEAARCREPRNAAVLHALGVYQLILGNVDEAEPLCAAAPTSSVGSRVRRLKLESQIALQRGDVAEAAKAYADAAKIGFPGMVPLEPLGMLEMLNGNLEAARKTLIEALGVSGFVRSVAGKTGKILQTHYGQVLNDLQLHGSVTDRAFEALRSPGTEVVAFLASLAREEPYALAPGLALSVLLRRLEMTGLAPGTKTLDEGQGKIPAILHMYWDQAEPPEQITDLIERWRTFHPKFDCRRYDDAAARSYLSQPGLETLRRAYALARHPAQKADLFRLGCLYKEGGVYVDVDDVCRRPITGLIPVSARLVVYQEDFFTIGNNYIAVVPGHETIAAALEDSAEAVVAGASETLWLSTGPGLLTRAFATTGIDTDRGCPIPGTVVLHRADLLRYVAIHRRLDYKTTTQHWSRMGMRSIRDHALRDPLSALSVPEL